MLVILLLKIMELLLKKMEHLFMLVDGIQTLIIYFIILVS